MEKIESPGLVKSAEPITGKDEPVSQKSSRRKMQTTSEMNEWPYEISVDLHSSPKPKIAFLSGEERKYYPENPGWSKLAQVFVANSHKGDTPNPNYTSPPIGVSKPISKKGYGIGGLFAKRFSDGKPSSEKRPDPGAYQMISRYPSRPNLYDIDNILLRKQCKVSFGSSLTVPRFGVQITIPPPGPGSYETTKCTVCTQMKVKASFGSRTCLIPTVVSVCAVGRGEICCDCGEEQLYDYYRTKTPIIHPSSINPGQPEIVALCRKCYCKAFNGHSAPSAPAPASAPATTTQWTKKELLMLFQKARNCDCMHEHNGLPSFLSIAEKNNIKRLAQKESVLAKYFLDYCPPEIKQ